MKKIVFLLTIIVLGITNPALSGISKPLWLESSPGGIYENGAPYDLVAHGTGNEFKELTWIYDDAFVLGDLELLEKYEYPEYDPLSATYEPLSATHEFTLNPTVATDTGTWQYTDGPLLNNPSEFTLYFSIKTADGNATPPGGWNLFVMRDNWDINQAVTWSTVNDFFTTDLDNLSNHAISHISFWKGPDLPDAVPEPATMLLLGFGLIGLAGIGRRNRKS